MDYYAAKSATRGDSLMVVVWSCESGQKHAASVGELSAARKSIPISACEIVPTVRHWNPAIHDWMLEADQIDSRRSSPMAFLLFVASEAQATLLAVALAPVPCRYRSIAVSCQLSGSEMRCSPSAAVIR
jgi:hypothetical protein